MEKTTKSKIHDLGDGLRLVHRQLLGVKSVAVGVLVGAGSSNETTANNGISHFIEHMFFKGTKKRNPFQISADIDSFGAQINAFTSKQTTCYYTLSTREQVENCMEVLEDILFNSTFDEEEMKREKGVVLEEISMSEDDAADVCMEKLSEVFFSGNSLAMSIIGTRKNIKSFGRGDILSYISGNYCAKNVIISIVGDIEESQASELAVKYFSTKFDTNKNPKWHDIKHITSPKFVYKKKDIEQAHIGLAFPSFKFADKNISALNILNTVFGGGMSSRLFQNIREKQGLAYNVYSYPSSYINNGIMQLYVGTNPESCNACCKTLREEIDKLKKDGIKSEEFERGKQQLKGAFVLGQESSSSIMRLNAKFALFGDKAFDIDEELEKINQTTLEQINGVVNEIFDYEKMSVSYTAKESGGNLLELIKNL